MAMNLRTKSNPATETVQEAPVMRRSPNSSNGNKSVAPAAFIRANKPLTKRIIVSLTGEEKSGKNYTAFTAPAPIFVHSFDVGLEGVVQKFQDDKEIYVAEYELSVQPGEGTANEVADSADKLWQQFVSNYRDGLASCGQGTTVIDTDTEVYELLRLARFGRLTQIMPHMYGPVNAELRDLLREPYGHAANVFFLSKKTDVWENYTDAAGREKGRKTGMKARKGFGDLPFLVQVVATTERDGNVFSVTIEDCRMNPDANGVNVPNDYDFIMSAIFGD